MTLFDFASGLPRAGVLYYPSSLLSQLSTSSLESFHVLLYLKKIDHLQTIPWRELSDVLSQSQWRSSLTQVRFTLSISGEGARGQERAQALVRSKFREFGDLDDRSVLLTTFRDIYIYTQKPTCCAGNCWYSRDVLLKEDLDLSMSSPLL